MRTKTLLSTIGLMLTLNYVTGQTISASLGSGTFVQGISPVTNTFTITGAPGGTDRINFVATDPTYQTVYRSYTDNNNADGFTWDVDMGQFPPQTVIWGEFYNSGNYNGNSQDLALDILLKPQWLIDGSVDNVTVIGNVISFEGSYPIYNYPYTISTTVRGIGGRSLNIIGKFLFDATYDITSSNPPAVLSSKAQIGLNILDQLPTFTKDINFSGTCSLDNSLNLSFVITEEISTPRLELNLPKIRFPIAGVFSVNVDAGLSLYATLKGQIILGENTGQWGFIDNGTDKTKIVGILTGEGFIRGEVSAFLGIASAKATLKAKARLGVGFDFVSVPSVAFTPLVGGDIDVWGEACVNSFWGRGPSKCISSVSWYYGQFGDTSAVRSVGYSFDNTFGAQSITFRDTGSLEIPNFNPQPAFGTRDDKLYTVWVESNGGSIGYLLFSKLNTSATDFSQEKIVVTNENSISNPKVALLPSGSAIITWTESRYNLTTLPNNVTDEEYLSSQDVWFAIYDVVTDSIIYKDRLGDDFSGPETGRAEGEAKVAVGDGNEAMITWVSSDAGTQTSDIWFTNLTESSNTWTLSPVAKLVDLTGANYNVQVTYTDTTRALAVWINDADGVDSTLDNSIVFSEWDGGVWGNVQTLASNTGSINFKQLSVSSNQNKTAIAWTSTQYENDNDFENRLEMEVWDNNTQDWDPLSYFEDADSLYYFQNPRVSISQNGIASICYQVVSMFPDTLALDNGELYLYLKDLNANNQWVEITDNNYICDDDAFIWELNAGFGGGDRYYTLTQEYNDNGVVTIPVNGVKFGDPNLSMVLRGLQVNSDLTLSDIAEPSVPTGINEISRQQNFQLFQNYPNPFSEFTTIEFQLQENANVQLEIYEFTGKLVFQILDKKIQAGLYKTQFNSGNLASGFYLGKLTVNGRSVCKKMIIAK